MEISYSIKTQAQVLRLIEKMKNYKMLNVIKSDEDDHCNSLKGVLKYFADFQFLHAL